VVKTARWVRNAKRGCTLLGTTAVLLTSSASKQAHAGGPKVIFKQNTIQIAFQNVYQPVFVFLWNSTGATIAITFAPVTQTNTQTSTNTINIGSGNNIGNSISN
jgi:hypothetical protein